MLSQPWSRVALPRLQVVLGILLGLSIAGCGALSQRLAVRTIGRILEDGMPAYARETDLELAESSLGTTVKLLEALLENDPDNPVLLEQTVQALATYTYAFVEVRIEAARGREPERLEQYRHRARRLYRRALQYGLRRLSRYAPAWRQATSLPLDTLEPLVQRLDRQAVPALFWTAFCWGNVLNLERTGLKTAAALPRLQALLTRLLELDETYFYGAPHLLQAVQYASRSPMLGGNPQQARWHFDRARELSQGRLLLVPLFRARYYAVQVQDRKAFTTLLQQIIAAPEGLFPDQAFLNAVAKRWAALFLGQVDKLFV
jgi:hypothetical protein